MLILKSLSLKTEQFKTLGYESNLVTHSDWESIATAAKNLSESIKADKNKFLEVFNDSISKIKSSEKTKCIGKSKLQSL